jgi:preprotein translocase subunit SecF
MEIIRPGINLDFIGKWKLAFGFSAFLFILTIALLFWRGGPNLGVDFTGGVVVQVKMDKKADIGQMRSALKAVQLEESIIQEFVESGQFEYLIRVTNMDIQLAGLGEKVRQALADVFGQGVELRQAEMVGPQVGEDLRQKALLAIFFSILFMAVYISGRFELKWTMSLVMALSLAFVVYLASSFGVTITWLIVIALVVTLCLCWVLNLKYALGAIVALIHDVAITVGAFALTDREVSLPIIAAFLTIVGYSVNDTIVIFDRIRENLRKSRKQPLAEVMNISINETLSRTILTSSTVMFVVVALFVLGGSVIHDFAFAMIVGLISGTYSTVYIASPVILLWEGKHPGTAAARK